MSKVRLGTFSDEEEVMQLCRELHKENALLGMNENKVREVMRGAFAQKMGIIGLIGEPGKLEAAIYLTFGKFWYSDSDHLEELFNYVRPAYRRSTNAKDLIQFAKKCAEDVGLPLVIGVLSNERTEAKVKLYERQLKKPAGAFFIYNFHNPTEQAAAEVH